MSYAVGQARPLRWLVAAPFSAPPTGRFVPASGERFRTLMTRLAPSAAVEVPQGLGQGKGRRATLEFQRPRDFRLPEVIKQIEPLGRLWDLADDLERHGKIESAAGKVQSIAGEGELLRAVQQLLEGGPPAPAAAPSPTPAPSPAPASPAASAGSALDAIFGKADIAPTSAEPTAASAAKSGLDAFIGAMRSKGDVRATVAKPAADRALAKQVADLLRRTVESTARGLMSAPALASLESAWRGLRMVISDAPGSDNLAIDMLDTSDEGLVARLRARLDVEPMERPDAVFVALPVAAPEVLRALAELGARSFVPVIVEVPAEATGARLGGRNDHDAVPEAWAELRGMASSQWLCAALNGVVLANEELAGVHRLVLGSPVWGLCAMLSASVGQTSGPGHVFGRAGALVSPASHDVADGHGQPIATERLATVDDQRALAERGVLVLGSERGSDRLRLAAAPTVHAGSDDLQLPGRILAGRAARFAQAIRDELPPHATPQEVAARLADASTNFLPRSPRGAVALQVRTDERGKLAVEASISAVLAGASFEFSSDL